jgi:murein DD-endopeptidase MepM/ murein hydrolase activator NlpD
MNAVTGLVDLAPGLLRTAWHEVLLSTVVCAIVLVVCRPIKGRWPAFEQALWALVLFRLVLPPSLAQPWGLGSLVKLLRPHTLATGESFAGLSTSPGSLTQSALAVPESAWQQYGALAAVVAWALAAATLLLWDASRLRRCRAWLRQATAITTPALTQILDAWRRRLHVRQPVQVLAVDAAVTPFTLGVRQPLLCLPRRLLEPTQELALHAALAHELAHVARRDTLWLWLQRAIQRLYFFHPVVWLVSRRLSAGREALCDRLVVAEGLMSSDDYSRGLLDALALDLRGVEALGLTHTKRRLAMRIRQVLAIGNPHQPRPRVAFAAAAVVGVFLLPLASGAAPDKPTQSAQSPTSSATAAAATAVRLSDPLPGSRVTLGYGQKRHPVERTPYFHRGIDMGAPNGTSILAAADGVVEVATTEYAPAKPSGTVVILDHGAGLKTFYAHLGPLAVKPGDRVTRGQMVARVGMSGLTTGPHLHFEVWQDGAHVDPATAIPTLGAVERSR